MKKLLICTALALTTHFAIAAEDSPTPAGRGGYGALRASGNLYCPIPRNSSGNAQTTSRHGVVYAKPTQYYYTKNNVISYGYAEEARMRSNSRTSYEGPRGAVFQPGDSGDSRTASSLRNYAAVNARTQPGVPMVPKRSATEDAKPGKKKRERAEP